MSKTTVLIPNYNGIMYIEACLDSLRKCGDYPVVIVDNGSEDGSVVIIREKYPEVRIIELTENTGFCHAVNVGLEEIDTPYVFLLNNDTEVEQNCIKILENRMDTDDRLFSAQAKILNLFNHDLIDDCGDEYNSFGWAYARGKDKPSDIYTTDSYCFAGCGAAVMYRMSLIKDGPVGFFDENHFAYLEDIDMGYRAVINGYRNLMAADAITYHAGSATSGSRHNRFKVNLSSKNNVYLIYKNMPFVQWLINLPLFIIGFGIKTLFFIMKGMGGTYIKGLMKGIGMCFADMFQGRKHKVRFRFSNLKNYCYIQLRLWLNVFRFVIK